MPELEFKGKQHIYAHHLVVPYRPLQPDPTKSVLGAQAEDDSVPLDGNLIIHDDNLHALKALLPRYAGRVKCIYIDPPYNTGNEGWVYNDNVNSPLMQEWLRENSPVDGEDLERHDKWLCMMWPRLHLLKELLSNDGVIFISIDDNEQHRLRMLIDEIFGENNFVANIVWQKKYAPANDAKYFSDNHDFILCYTKNRAMGTGKEAETWQRQLLPRTEKQDRLYKYDDGDGKGPWRTGDLTAKTYSPDYDYPIVNPNTGKEHYPSQGRSWTTSKEQMQVWLEEHRVFFGKDGNSAPQLKRYLREVQQGIVPLTIWTYDEVGHSDGARKTLKELFSEQRLPFDNPKALGLLQRILTIAADKDAIILDSFAGSGTTAHAVLALNKEDGGNRRFILVECEDYADSITAERVRRVIRGVPDARDDSLRKGMGGSFTYCTLGAPIDIEKMLTGESLPPFASLAAYLLHTASGSPAGEAALQPQNDDGLFHTAGSTDYYLLYEPDIDWLRTDAAMLNEVRAKRIAAACEARGSRAVVFAAGQYMGQRALSRLRITFCRLPYELHRAVWP